MNTEQVINYYKNKKDTPCPLTEELIKAGYQQGCTGYIKYAKEQGVTVDYREAKPHQCWHLIEAYCNNTNANKSFDKKIQCGELIFWMAEVADCVDEDKMRNLVNEIIASGEQRTVRSETKPNVKYARGKWNREIQTLCFENITKTVENFSQIK